MKAVVIKKIQEITPQSTPLETVEFPTPKPKENEILIEISTCGVCHTELDEIEGRTPPPFFPVIPGHQVVGKVVEIGANVTTHNPGDRVGVAWIFSSCGSCEYCLRGDENLCPDFKATGRDAHGGYAKYMVVPAPYAIPIPEMFTDLEAAPLLCAGAIGYRSLKLTGIKDGNIIGLTGFGGSGHIVLKLVKHIYPNSPVFVFSRTSKEREFAIELGAVWAGEIPENPPELLDAVIDTTPVWKPVLESLLNLKPGGRLVINAIRKEDSDEESLLDLDYSSHLWMEKEIKSVANVTRSDVSEFINLASKIPLIPETQEFSLEEANRALVELKTRKIRGAKVLRIK
ncbi:MAG: zinc-dependent alcohol dehydrogenase family protein [Anaerolineales bacterium]